jgi:hypothetical protein
MVTVDPVVLLNAKPAGNAPLVIDHVYGPAPPDTAQEVE